MQTLTPTPGRVHSTSVATLPARSHIALILWLLTGLLLTGVTAWSQLTVSVQDRLNLEAIYLIYNVPVGPSALDKNNYSISGLTVQGATAGATPNEVTLQTSQQTRGENYFLSIFSNVQGANGETLPGNVTESWTFAAAVQEIRIKQERINGYLGSDLNGLSGLMFNEVSYVDSFEGPLNNADNYTIRLSGLLNPPVTGGYQFWMSSDDQGELYLSSDADPAHKVLIAREPAWNGSREFTNGQNQGSRGNPPANTSSEIQLTAGTQYYVELLWREGGGGDNGSATWQIPGGPAVANGSLPIPASSFHLQGLVLNGQGFQTLGPITITSPLAGQNVLEGQSVTFGVGLDGSPPYQLQWRKDGADIPGATAPTYTIVATPGPPADFSVVVRNPFSEAISGPATLNVTADTTRPTLVSARANEARNGVTVKFSEPVDSVTATTVANYALLDANTALPITIANLVNPSTIFLSTAPQTPGATYTLTVNNVTDASAAKNPITPNTTATFRGFLDFPGVLGRQWDGATTPEALRNLPNYPDNPDRVYLLSNTYLGSEGRSFFGTQLESWFTPNTTADYVLYVASDDSSGLYLSTDADPANAVRIAEEPSWNNEGTWTTIERRDPVNPENRSDEYLNSQWLGGPGPIKLEAGKVYYIGAIAGESEGGDHVGFTIKLWGQPDPANGSDPAFADLGKLNYRYDPTGSFVNITQQPQDVTATEGRTVTFSVSAESGWIYGDFDPHRTYQWRCATPNSNTFVDVQGATTATYTTPDMTIGDSGQRCLCTVSVPGAEATSNPATVTVLDDTQAPLLIEGFATFATSVQIIFDERVDAASAQQPNNYELKTLGGTITPIVGAAIAGSGNEVTLTLGDPVIFGNQYLLTVHGVQDLFGNGVDNQTVCVVFQLNQSFADALSSLNPVIQVDLNKAEPAITFPIGGTATGLVGVHFVDGVPSFHLPVEGADFPGLGGGNFAVPLNGNNWLEIQGGSPLDNATGFTVMVLAKAGPMPEPRVYPFVSEQGIFSVEAYDGDPNDGQIDVEFNSRNGGGEVTSIPDDGRWHLIVCVWDGTDLIIYVDGVEKARGISPIMSTAGIGAYPIQLGRGDADSNTDRFGSGFVDEFAVWDRPLLNTQISGIWGAANQDSSGEPPVITFPSQVNLVAGQPFELNLGLSDSDTPLGDVWVNAVGSPANFFLNGLTIVDEGASLQVKGTLATDASGVGKITLSASDGRNFTWGETAVTYTFAETPPVFTDHPQNQSFARGQDITLTAQASGYPVPTYIWWHNGQLVANATGPTLTILSAGTDDVGTYHCEAINFQGVVFSNPAQVIIEGSYSIELEDFNAGGDSTPGVNGNQYPGGGAAGLGATLGTDYWDDGSPSDSNAYRPGINGALIEAESGNSFRGDYTLTFNFKIGWSGTGWNNYTRNLPPGSCGALGSFQVPVDTAPGTVLGSLERVTSDPAMPNQTVENLGVFKAPQGNPGGGYQFVPLVNLDGQLVKIPVGDETSTFRVTIPPGTPSGLRGDSLMLSPYNFNPEANDDSFSGTEDPVQPLTGNVLANDTDVEDGKPPVVANPGERQTPGGPVNLAADGSFTFTPGVNFNGPVTFTYEAADSDGAKDTATVTINVTPVNDPPVATEQQQEMDEDTSKDIVLESTDVDGGSPTYAVVTPPTHGTLSGTPPNVTYTPDPNYAGLDQFTFKANDGMVDSEPAMVAITVKPVNDPPVATPQQKETDEDTAITIVLESIDVDGGSPTYAIVTPPTNGTLSGTPPNVTYTPKENYFGPDSFTFKANDGMVDSETAVVSLTVKPVNDAPVAQADTATTLEDQPVSGNVLGNDTDADGDSLTVHPQPVQAPQHGTVTLASNGAFTYTPNADFNGTDTITYEVSDPPGAKATGVVTINVTAVNDPPTVTWGPDIFIPYNPGRWTIENWVTHITVGPPDEPQEYRIVVQAENPEDFTEGGQPEVSPGGTLTFETKPNHVGPTRVRGQVEERDNPDSRTPEYHRTITVLRPTDFGDAPELAGAAGVPFGYPTTNAKNGARHVIVEGFTLGLLVDYEADGQPNATATGDGEDEDGVVFALVRPDGVGLIAGTPGAQNTVRVTTSVPAGAEAFLNGWVDFNLDGDWNDPGEQVFTNIPVGPGIIAHLLTFATPAGVAPGSLSFCRFRLSSQSGLSPEGSAPDGEVEDYQVAFEEMDFGDALAIHGPAAHTRPANSVTFLGAKVDADPLYQSSADATGDDLDANGDDEDGVIFRGPLIAGLLATVDVTANAAGQLDIWIDYNGAGGFERVPPAPDVSEYVNDRLPGVAAGAGAPIAVVPGLNRIRFFVPDKLVAGLTFARFRFAPALPVPPDPAGVVLDGEVEDYEVQLFDVLPDFGDAPDSLESPAYPTLLTHDGALHLLTVAGFHLGTRLDIEADGQPHLEALGDDLESPADGNPDDEDGVRFLTPLTPEQPARIEVTTTMSTLKEAKLNGWLDFNADNDWLDTGEQILTDVPLAEGVQTLEFTVPADAKAGRTYARFRMNRTGRLSPNGPAESGEVEDYAVEITTVEVPLVIAAPKLADGKLRLEWSGTHVLQRAPSPAGPWEDVPEVTSPFEITPTEDSAFFRLRTR